MNGNYIYLVKSSTKQQSVEYVMRNSFIILGCFVLSSIILCLNGILCNRHPVRMSSVIKQKINVKSFHCDKDQS